MRPFKLALGLAATALLIGCTPDKKKSADDSAATFVVKSVEGKAFRGPVDDKAAWKVPTSVELNLLVCLQDRSSRTDLRNQLFYVNAPGGRTVRTNSYGCLQWSESLPFNFYAGHSAWVTIRREIVGRDVNAGRRTVDLGVNPWAVGDHPRDHGRPIVFLRDETVTPVIPADEAMAYLAGDAPSQGDAKLVIQEVKVKAIPSSETSTSIRSSYMIEMEPRILTRRANGERDYARVDDGDFDVEMQLIAATVGAQQNQKVLVLDPASKPRTTGHLIDGTLRAELSINQSERANAGSMEMAVRIKPKAVGLHSTIKDYNGLFALGLGTIAKNGSGVQFSQCDEDSTACDFDKVIASTSNVEDLKKAGYVRENDRYQFSKIKLRFLGVQPGETATQRTVSYTASVCVKDIYGEPLAFTPLTIRYKHQDKSKIRKTSDDSDDSDTDQGEVDQHDEIERPVISQQTDQDGCLNWDGLVFHKYYKPEQYFERNIEIEKSSGFRQSFTYYINPWDTNVNFGFDAREFPDKIQELRHRAKIKSRFFLGNYGYHTVRFLYNIDPFMELEVRKTVLMELSPQVLRYSGIKDARKMVEHLRDGIYLMKVGIQKSYLDPRDNSRWLLTNAPSLQAPQTQIGNEKLATKDFVTTNMVLVRVVDGMIIYPIELTMRDLRLMRVRSNFMVELQTVDERLIQAYHVFRQQAITRENMEDALKAFKKKLEGSLTWEEALKNPQGLAPDLKGIVDERQRQSEALKQQIQNNSDLLQARRDLEAKLKETQNTVKFYLEALKKGLQDGGSLGRYLNSAGQPTEIPVELLKDAHINDNFQLDEKVLAKLKSVLIKNDFSKVTLPSRDDVDLELFVENDSGLAKRSFVGPVIFLSNAYSDSVRATDNLDEVKCADAAHPKDVIQQSADALKFDVYEQCLYANPENPEICSEDRAQGNANLSQQNNKYKENPFFGSLSHLCFKNVDDLMIQEKAFRATTDNRLAAASLKYNFINSFPFKMDYVSLTDEPLKKFDESCNGFVADCLVETKVGTLPAAALEPLVNKDLERARDDKNWSFDGWISWLRGRSTPITKTHWSRDELGQLFFERNANTSLGVCNLIANRITQQLVESKLNLAREWTIRRVVADLCNSDHGLIHDVKLRIENTGSYAFLGGLNLNFNVGESFSMGTSYGYGAELSDFVGAFMGMGSALKAAGGILVKPFSIKKGISESSGTSVSESTYLVSQIAKFEVDLTAYEKCAVVRLSDEAVKKASEWVNSGTASPSDDLILANFRAPGVVDTFRRGLMVCEGDTRKNNRPLRVEEMYFYFTQHFTEGDMLDQADLYNHPWLLAMRGMRDFTTFVNKIRAQDPVNMAEFSKMLVGWQDERKKAYALEHMSAVYADVLPSFPGYYTLLDRGEDISAFLLQQSRKFSKVDKAPLGEDPPIVPKAKP